MLSIYLDWELCDAHYCTNYPHLVSLLFYASSFYFNSLSLLCFKQFTLWHISYRAVSGLSYELVQDDTLCSTMSHFKRSAIVLKEVVLSSEVHLIMTNVYYTITTSVISECAELQNAYL